MKFDLCNLYEKCLSVDYKTVDEEGSYATYKIDGTRYIFFEKSNGAADWKNNFDFPAKPYDGMDVPWYCHRGFLRVWKGLVPYIEKILRSSMFDSAVIVGYSHGAALSALCFEYVWYNYSDVRDRLYGFAFGSPRVFYGKKNYDFLKTRFLQYVNVMNYGDIVTKVPPKIFGYRHIGKMLWIGNDKKLISVNAHRPESYKLALKGIKCVIDV